MIEDKDLRIVEMRVDNYMRLKAVRIRPDGSLIQIRGRNGAGKSSILSAIGEAIGIKDLTAEVPIRKGQKQAAIYVDLGELRITKIFDQDQPARLVFEYKDGSRPRSPQKVLESLRGHLVDPLAFIRAKAADRLAMVQTLFPDFDFAAYARSRKSIFSERTAINRELKAAKATHANLHAELPPGPKPEAIDVREAMERLRAANDTNAGREQRARRRAAAVEEIEDLLNAAELLRAQATEKEAEATALQKRLDEAPALPAPIDTAPIEATIHDSTERAAIIRRHEEVEALEKSIKYAAEMSANLTTEIDRLDAQKVAAISGDKLPFPGLSIASAGEDGAEAEVVLNDLPFSQASQAEQIRAATAVAMALAPRIRVLLIRDGSLLDSEGLALIADIAEKNRYQVWLEGISEVAEPGKVFIEDGEVRP